MNIQNILLEGPHMTETILISGIILVSAELLVFAGVRKNYISPWIALIIVCLVSAASGIIYIYLKGENLIGALCLSPLLAFSFGIPTLIFSFALKRKV